ncbi:unnamed protein product [Arabis nemorensis]|uniref:SET domain-containing protein n=1 Tax=Arabis nemorensis TaxID=586526 RepID=A0A565BMM4_9BRAS|nr:unnamed protein product [Arabis nemorensis]
MDNMVHRESSKLSSSEEKLAEATALRNCSYTIAPMEPRKSRRLKVAAVSETSVSLRLRLRTNQKEVHVESCENMNVSDGFVPSSEAEVVGERDHLKSVDEKLCNDMDVGGTEGDESHRDNMQKLKKDMNLPKNTSDQNMADVVEVQPLSYCLPEEVGNSVCRRRMVGTRQLRGRKIPIVRDFPPNIRSNFSRTEKTVKVAISKKNKNLVLEKSDSRDHLDQSLTKNISLEGLEPLELEKSKVTFQKPIEVASRRITRKGLAVPSPLKLSKNMNGEYGEGSRMKNSGKDIQDKESFAPLCPSGSSSGYSARYKVKETLCLFYAARRKILGEVEARPREKKGSKFRVDYEALQLLKSKGQCLNNGDPVIGHVPGVVVGDEFQYRMELNILGIHRPNQGGIDYIKENEELVATSIVSSGCYDDEVDNLDFVIYTGQGGNAMKGQKKGQQNLKPKDQQLVTGNLALVNSKAKKNPVRVIRGNKKTPSSGDEKNYVYDGLYLVEEYWKETGSHGKHVYKFRLRRMPGQPELFSKVVKKSKQSKLRAGRCNVDLSGEKERFPIYAVNDLDDEKLPPFIYTVEMIYPDWCRPIPPRGCGCTKRCSESKNCACVAKNGGELPYNHNGAIVNAKPVVYECGPLCKCPPSCYLRATQQGLKFQLEIFKTESRGWGVRSINSIPSGSFICEYAGELLEDKEAERLTGEDEYLFDIDKEDEMSGFVIDAAKKGNIGRFINHSCSPNLYAQEVLYDHEEKRIPHIMFFAGDNIPPLEELSYDYNYKIDQKARKAGVHEVVKVEERIKRVVMASNRAASVARVAAVKAGQSQTLRSSGGDLGTEC